MRPNDQRARWLAVLIATIATGCAQHSPSSGCAKTRPDRDSDATVAGGEASRDWSDEHDAGSVLAGATVSHIFSFRNPSDKILMVHDRDLDIQSSCGCTQIEVADHYLRPGQSTAISLKIRTRGKRGRVAEYATIRWSAPETEEDSHQGDAYTTRFVLQANVEPPVRFTPSEIIFSKKDIEQGLVKKVVCKSRHDVDWANVTCTSSASFVSIARREFSGSDLVLWLTCHSSAPIRGVKLAVVELTELESPSGQPWTGSLRVTCHHPLGLQVAPRLVQLRQTTSGRSDAKVAYAGTLIVSGDVLLRDGSTVKVDGGPIWEVGTTEQRIGKSAVRLEIVATAADETAIHTPLGHLTLRVSAGSESVEVPTRLLKTPVTSYQQCPARSTDSDDAVAEPRIFANCERIRD